MILTKPLKKQEKLSVWLKQRTINGDSKKAQLERDVKKAISKVFNESDL